MSVFKRKDTQSPFYYYEFQINGRPFKGSTKCTVERDALAVERQKRVEAEQQLALERLDPERATVSDIFGRYWKNHGFKLKDTAVKVHMLEMEAFFGADKPFCDITNADVSAMLEDYGSKSERKNRGGSTRPGRPSDTTINRRMAVFRRIYNVATNLWDLPTQRIKFQVHTRKEPKERVRHVTIEQGKAILRKLPPHINLMAAFSLSTGCRLNETESLTWSRVNFETRQAEVLTKGGGTRFVDLNADALTILQITDRSRVEVFDSTNRRKHWERALAEVGVEDFHWHDMRHTFATWLGRTNAGLHVIQKALGHSRVETTMRYLHVLRADVEDYVRKLPTIIEGEVLSLTPPQNKSDNPGPPSGPPIDHLSISNVLKIQDQSK